MDTVYILKSLVKEKFYIGYTSNIKQRVGQHNAGLNSSTKTFRPWVLVYSEILPDKKSAWLREHQIKRYKGGEAFRKLIGLPPRAEPR